MILFLLGSFKNIPINRIKKINKINYMGLIRFRYLIINTFSRFHISYIFYIIYFPSFFLISYDSSDSRSVHSTVRLHIICVCVVVVCDIISASAMNRYGTTAMRRSRGTSVVRRSSSMPTSGENAVRSTYR